VLGPKHPGTLSLWVAWRLFTRKAKYPQGEALEFYRKDRLMNGSDSEAKACWAQAWLDRKDGGAEPLLLDG
jgi:hypothetical protein